VAYSLQVYFDFSGYSDMAIGLGHVFGFKFPENFNYPFIADSITNFWRRWHISLSSWFRDYIYIPLGGNRVKAVRHVLNILVVWMLTGFWHGADWNFILWGAYFGIVMLVEKRFLSKMLEKTPALLRHVYVMLIIFISWAFFDSIGFNTSFITIGRMFGVGANGFAGNEALYYLRSYAVALVVGVVGATPLIKKISEKVAAKKLPATLLEPMVLAIILVATTACMVDGSYNPFIYFRF
jgi:alginate O-acetyltransferase complex protein AlgI